MCIHEKKKAKRRQNRKRENKPRISGCFSLAHPVNPTFAETWNINPRKSFMTFTGSLSPSESRTYVS